MFIGFLENRKEVTIVNYRTDNGNTLVSFEDKNLYRQLVSEIVRTFVPTNLYHHGKSEKERK